MLGFVAWTLLSGVGPDDGALPLALASIDVANIVMAYAAFHMLATRTAPPGGVLSRLAALASLPAYWVLHSVAAWRAVWQLYRDPFRWEKTEHVPVQD